MISQLTLMFIMRRRIFSELCLSCSRCLRRIGRFHCVIIFLVAGLRVTRRHVVLESMCEVGHVLLHFVGCGLSVLDENACVLLQCVRAFVDLSNRWLNVMALCRV